MKKIFTAAIIAIISLISINMWGQITYSKPESKPYERIVSMGREGICHYFPSDKYRYIVCSSNQFEDLCKLEVTLPEIKFTLEELDCLTLTPQQVTLLLPFITE